MATLQLGQRYTGVGQADGQVLVSAVGAPMGSGARVEVAEFERWFRK